MGYYQRQPKDKIPNTKRRRKGSQTASPSADDIKGAMRDADRLKKKKKRLSIDWFFRPSGD